MSRNEYFAPTEVLSLPVPDGTAPGTAVRVLPAGGAYSATNDLQVNGVAITGTDGSGVPSGVGHKTGYAAVALDGVWLLPITTTTAIAVGGPVYITSAGALTPVSTSNALFGHVVDKAKGTTAGEIVPVRPKN